jgi:branched-chain amino acid transport system substrate-binding protein
MRRSNLLWLAPVLISLVGPTACGGGDETILIGEFGSMTGSEATFGQATHKGIMLAVEEQNAAGGVKGKKIEVKSYDDKGAAQEAGNAVLRLCSEDHVVALLGEVASSLSIAGGRVAQQQGVPMITPSSTNAKVTKIGDMIHRVCFVDDFQGFVAAKFCVDHLKAKNVAILYDQKQAYSTGLKDDFKKAFSKLGGTVPAEPAYSGGDQDFSAQLTAIRDANPDAIYIPGYYTDVGNIALQARKLGLKQPLVGGDGWDSPQLIEIGKAAIEGCYYSNHYSEEEKRPAVEEFVKKWKAKNPDYPPDGLAALGYDAARLLFDAMNRAPSLSGKDIAKAIAETKDFKGVTGVITIDKDRNAQKSAVMLEIKDGKPHYVATIEPGK